MVKVNKPRREQLILRHVSDADGDWLVEVGQEGARRWQPVVEENTLTLTSITALSGNHFGSDTSCADIEPTRSFSLSGITQAADTANKVYGIDISESDPEYLIAQRVDNNIGIDLISRAPQEFYEGGLKAPYASEIFVSTDGWYYGDTESIQLLFDVPDVAITELFEAVQKASLEKLMITVKCSRWIPRHGLDAAGRSADQTPSVIYGYRGTAHIRGWEVLTRVGE